MAKNMPDPIQLTQKPGGEVKAKIGLYRTVAGKYALESEVQVGEGKRNTKRRTMVIGTREDAIKIAKMIVEGVMEEPDSNTPGYEQGCKDGAGNPHPDWYS